MGFFDFLKKKKTIEENERVRFNELESWIHKKLEQNEEKEKELLNLIKQRIPSLVSDFEKELIALKSIDMTKKKANDQIKFLVHENLNSYISFLSDLMQNLKDLDRNKNSLEPFMARMNFLFYDFNKKSFTSYEKATFLIGEELGQVRESIKIFLNDLNSILEQDKDLLKKSKILGSVLSKISEIKRDEKIKLGIEENIKKIGQKLIEVENKFKSIEKNIEKITNSEEYSEKLRKQGEIKQKKNNVKNDLMKLKEAFDLKTLAKTFYGDEKRIRLIKDYDLNFNDYFKAGDLSNLLDLIEESRGGALAEQISAIKDKEKEIAGFLDEKDETVFLREKLAMARSDTDNILKEKFNELKRIQKLEEKKQEIIASIKSELAKLNVEVK